MLPYDYDIANKLLAKHLKHLNLLAKTRLIQVSGSVPDLSGAVGLCPTREAGASSKPSRTSAARGG